ncbi:RNase adapter RapZ [Citroniella saccharovorans]|uniref:RNase adapter RapZ n=1 Tax=Citroniella saccharovorans TaxID=2053367 RepID=A0AAW9MYH9_9FIRM|nr:RNase adapter RapZ [Citroniella saccharovorans]MEB3429470.1 RNase adapter RapZ [Citroniella saccharovorans]
MKIVVVTGMSGAGKSTALNILEDLGYYCLDNLPSELLDSFIDIASRTNESIDKIALGLDIRGVGFLENIKKSINNLRDKGLDLVVLFLDANNKTLVRRYKELRRPHPMEVSGNVLSGIEKEREALENIKKDSDFVINTSNFKIADLKSSIMSISNLDLDKNKMSITIVSFGFKNGILLDADLVFDVRLLPNPYYIDGLKEKNGLSNEVREFVLSYKQTGELIEKIVDYINFSYKLYENEGKNSLVLGIGCTGGKHRSVAIANKLFDILKEKYPFVFLSHRDERLW